MFHAKEQAQITKKSRLGTRLLMSSQLSSVPGGGNIVNILIAGIRVLVYERKKEAGGTYNEHNATRLFHQKLYTPNHFQNRRNSFSSYAFSHKSYMVSCDAGSAYLSDMFSYLGSGLNDAREVRNVAIRGW